MTDMDNNFKKTWQDARFTSTDSKNMEDLIDGGKKTALQSLAKRYRIFSNISLAMILCSVGMVNMRLFEPPVSIWFALAMATYFLIASVMDWWLYRGISSIDCATMTVGQVIGKALFYRKRHFQFMAVLLPMALGVVGAFVWLLTDQPYMLLSIGLGFIAGLAIGLRQLFEFMSDYRRIISQ